MWNYKKFQKRQQTQAAKMYFSLRDRVQSSHIRERLGVEQLFLHTERSHIRFQASPSGRKPRGRPR